MAINKGTLAKKVNGVLEYIYPKTSADMVMFGNTNLGSAVEALQNNTVAPEAGKGLSTNDFTNAYKSMLDDVISVSGNNNYLDATKLTGTIDIARLPAGALERLVPVTNDTARFALTTSDVQLGDTVKVTATGNMYIVTDTANLDSEAGYTQYTAGAATSVAWSGVTGKPSTFTPSSHTHTISEVTDISTAHVAEADSANSVAWSDVQSKPSSFTPSSHTHLSNDITDLATTVAGLDAGTVNGKTVASNVPSDAVFTDTVYTHPSYTSKSSGLYNITVDSTGHVSAATAVEKSDITSLGIPTSDTTYSADNSTTVLDGTTFKLKGSIITAGSYGPSADVTGSNGNTIKVPQVTVDQYGRVTSIAEKTFTAVNSTDFAATSHTHDSSDITSLDATKLTGTIDIARLPAGALERIVTVTDQTARFALTTSDVQLGDTVKQEDTGVMYMVSDTTNLDSASGYTEYTAGSATSVPWSGVTGKPSTFTASSHTHTSSDITDLATTVAGLDAGTVNGKTVGINVPADAVFTDTVYTHPSHTAKSSGLYKITVDSLGHVSAATAVEKSDITSLGIPESDTTYSADDATTVLDGTTFKLKGSIITASTKGATEDVTGSNNSTIKVPKVTVDQYGRVTGLTEYTYTSKDTTYSADDATTVLDGTTFKLKGSIVTAGTKGPTANVTGSNGNTIKVPQVTVDQYGRVTGLTEYTYTSVDNGYTSTRQRYTIAASGWVENSGGTSWTYTLPYSNSEYIVNVYFSNPTMTLAQYNAFVNGIIIGSDTANTLTALGVKPSVDMPVLLELVPIS